MVQIIITKGGSYAYNRKDHNFTIFEQHHGEFDKTIQYIYDGMSKKWGYLYKECVKMKGYTENKNGSVFVYRNG